MKKKSGNIFPIIQIGFLVLFIMMIMAPQALAKPKKIKVRAMTRNLYLGADIFKVVDAAQTDPLSVPFVVAEVFQTMLYTNFHERAEAIADEIARKSPHVVGLQEVSTFYIQTPGDFLAGNPVQADTLVIDFYSVLDAALKARGLNYKAYTVTNADVELPMADPNAGPPYYLSDVRMVDHDVVLVRKGLRSWEVESDNYEEKVEFDLGGTGDPVQFIRGYVIVDVKIKREIFRFVNTHLEVRSSPGSYFRVVQSAQMAELLSTIGDLTDFVDPIPVIMLGDFNSSPLDVPGMFEHPLGGDIPYVPPYQLAVAAGFSDAWLMQRRYGDGFTSGFDEYVSDPAAKLTSRIDLVFLHPMNFIIEKVKCDVVGDEIEDMTPSGLWPSDHAGVAAKVKFRVPK
jgi:hypothetical protein